MKVGIDAMLLSGQPGYRRSGIGRYLEQLLAALPNAAGRDELVVYAGRGVTPPNQSLSKAWKETLVPTHRASVRVAWEHTSLPLLARRDRLTLFHGAVNVVPRLMPCPSVVTIHDLAFLRWPEQVPSRRYQYLSREVKSGTARASRVIAISESTKADVVELLGISPERVSVTHLGVDPRFRLAMEDEKRTFRTRASVQKPYILAVGNLEPRKNLPGLLRAFSLLSNDFPHDLILVGAEAWLAGDIHATIERLKLSGRVRMTGFVDDADLPLWYGCADLFAFPSLYEGFGLPPIEAMACGVPVVTSNVSSLPEVVGDAAIMVNPLSDEEIASAMSCLLSDESLASAMTVKGLERAKQFTWEQTADQTMAIYRQESS